MCDLPFSFYTPLSNILFDSHDNPVRYKGNIIPISQGQTPRRGDEMLLPHQICFKDTRTDINSSNSSPRFFSRSQTFNQSINTYILKLDLF